MTLYDLLQLVNDSTIIDIFAECTGTCIGEYNGKDDVPDRYQDEEVTDIFTAIDNASEQSSGYSTLCIEIAIDPDEDYDE